MTASSIQQAESSIEEYLSNKIMYDNPGTELSADFPLLEQGLIDSVQLVRLVGFLEENFRVVIKTQEITPENFGSIRAMAALVDRLGGS